MYFYDFYLNCYFVIETISFHKLKYFGKVWKAHLHVYTYTAKNEQISWYFPESYGNIISQAMACDMIFPQLSNEMEIP